MESSTWDFDAPEFVDFGANEHEVAVGRDSYFGINLYYVRLVIL